tara:strand:+ start:140 stop:244 length:105 start_codon:yes stop_codon:yes gene_type:complete
LSFVGEGVELLETIDESESLEDGFGNRVFSVGFA